MNEETLRALENDLEKYGLSAPLRLPSDVTVETFCELNGGSKARAKVMMQKLAEESPDWEYLIVFDEARKKRRAILRKVESPKS